MWRPFKCAKWSIIVAHPLALSCNQSRIVSHVSLWIWIVNVLGVNWNLLFLMSVNKTGALFLLCRMCYMRFKCLGQPSSFLFVYQSTYVYNVLCWKHTETEWMYDCKVLCFWKLSFSPQQKTSFFDKLVKEQKRNTLLVSFFPPLSSFASKEENLSSAELDKAWK